MGGNRSKEAEKEFMFTVSNRHMLANHLSPEDITQLIHRATQIKQQLEKQICLGICCCAVADKIIRGNWEQNGQKYPEKTGKGAIYEREKYFYYGDITLENPDGEGIKINWDKSIYLGTFQKGKLHSAKYFRSEIDLIIEGQWEQDQLVESKIIKSETKVKKLPDKRYEINFKQGQKYVGQIKIENGQLSMDGHGIFKQQQYQYEGQWLKNNKNGNGTVLYANGHKYQGQFKNNKKHGRGKYIFEENFYIEGLWENDELKTGKIFEHGSERDYPQQ